MIDDEKIIELFFERSEQAIQELDTKYGKICYGLSYNILNCWHDVEDDNISTSSVDRTKLEVGSKTDLSTYLEWYREIIYSYCTETEDTSEHRET